MTFVPEKPLSLPAYPGSVWRSAFGARLRRNSCITGADACGGCRVQTACAYGRLFEPAPDTEAVGLHARFRDPPRPYVISPRHAGGYYRAGQPLVVELLLFASAIRELASVRRVAARLSLRGAPLRPLDISALDAHGEAAAISGANAAGFVPEPPAVPKRVRLRIEHPLRLRRDGKYLDDRAFSPDAFFTALLRRVSSLHDGANKPPLSADYAALARHAAERIVVQDARLEWFDWQRRSARQGRWVPMGGVVGELTLGGDLAPLWPWLWIGQWTHVGKGAVMGLGRYRLEDAG